MLHFSLMRLQFFNYITWLLHVSNGPQVMEAGKGTNTHKDATQMEGHKVQYVQ